MTEETIVRENLMTKSGYAPYCGAAPTKNLWCSMPRMIWNSEKKQFVCPCCGHVSEFPDDFISRYMKKWNL